ncbi:MAG: rhodanese-like domain-containing protein [Pseudomonadota bacterium]
MPPFEQFVEFASNHPVLSSAVVASMLLVVFTELNRKAGQLANLEPADAVRLMNNDAVVVDTRAAEQYRKGHLPGAKALAADQLAPGSDKLKAYEGRPVLIVCDNGMASGRLAKQLRKSGRDDVFSLKGGVAAWQSDNLPLVTEKKAAKGKKRKG